LFKIINRMDIAAHYIPLIEREQLVSRFPTN